ncbi:hypothetical protein D4764_12G0009420 [Takifugu flavidus]|uniref:Reverse transcriptase domain-containing protein n=1 Tax=Takifugu flavidus TaxID=433684 RepID=A0A5C6PCL5_9TELE|nr:hypothetical protein D4764_12G0009420 [Takifugu flavidus]
MTLKEMSDLGDETPSMAEKGATLQPILSGFFIALVFMLGTQRQKKFPLEFMQKFSDDTAIVGRVSEGNELEYREVITNFVAWCELNHLRINASKTKEVVINFSRKASHIAPVNIQGLDIEIVEEYKYLGVHLNNKLDWTHNTDALYKRGQSHLHLLRRLRSFGDSFYDSVVASVIFYAVVCWSCGSSERDRKRLNKLLRRAGSVLDCSLDSIEEVGERRMLAKLTSIMDTPSHPLHETVGALSSSFSSRLLHPPCKRERYRRNHTKKQQQPAPEDGFKFKCKVVLRHKSDTQPNSGFMAESCCYCRQTQVQAQKTVAQVSPAEKNQPAEEKRLIIRERWWTPVDAAQPAC